MPDKVEAYVEDGFATITSSDPETRQQILSKLLKNTPPALLEKQTRSGPHVAYRVPEGNAREAGLLDGAQDGVVPERKDLGTAQALVDADPQVSGRGGQHGEYRTPMAESTVDGLAYGARSGTIRGPLRPNKPVDSAPSVPAVSEDVLVTGRPVTTVSDDPSEGRGGRAVSTLTSDLQKKVHENTPYPVDYAPAHIPLNERVPSAQGTIAAVVDRAPTGPSEPASGIGVGPQAGRITETEADQGSAGEFAGGGRIDPVAHLRTSPLPDRESVQQQASPGTTEAPDSEPEPAPAKKAAAKKAPAKKAAAKKTPAKKAPAKKAAK